MRQKRGPSGWNKPLQANLLTADSKPLIVSLDVRGRKQNAQPASKVSMKTESQFVTAREAKRLRRARNIIRHHQERMQRATTERQKAIEERRFGRAHADLIMNAMIGGPVRRDPVSKSKLLPISTECGLWFPQYAQDVARPPGADSSIAAGNNPTS